MIYGHWVSVWKKRMLKYAQENNIIVPAGFKPKTWYWGIYAEHLAEDIKKHAGVQNPTGKLDGQLRKVLSHTTLETEVKPPFYGIDVSNHNGYIDWTRVPRDKYKFVWAKATEGHTYEDAFYTRNKLAAEGNGFTVGAYHFMHADTPSGMRDQMDHFLSVAKYKPGDLLPVLDWENTKGSMVDVPSQAATLEAAVKYVKEKIGKYPVIYSGAYVLNANRLSSLSVVRKCPLWIAAYPTVPFTPKPWNSYDVHQFSSTGSVPGINGNVDMNVSHVPLSVLT